MLLDLIRSQGGKDNGYALKKGAPQKTTTKVLLMSLKKGENLYPQ